MKILAIISILLGAGAVGTGVYSLVETYPNYKSASRRSYSGYGGYGGRASSRLGDLDRMLYRSYEEALKTQIILGPWAAGGLALILGLVAGIKKRKLGFVGAGLGIVAVVISLLVQPSHW